MKQKIMIVVALVAFSAVPVSTFAATYGYINTQGMLKTVVANTPAEAILLPTDRAERSGVIFLSNDNTFGSTTTITLGK